MGGLHKSFQHSSHWSSNFRDSKPCVHILSVFNGLIWKSYRYTAISHNIIHEVHFVHELHGQNVHSLANIVHPLTGFILSR